MTNRTKGNWQAIRAGDTWHVVSVTGDEPADEGIAVATVQNSRAGYTSPQDAADAKMLASAPAMQDALAEMRAYSDSLKQSRTKVISCGAAAARIAEILTRQEQ